VKIIAVASKRENGENIAASIQWLWRIGEEKSVAA